MEIRLTNARIITPYKEIEKGSVIIKDGKISEVLEGHIEGEDLEGMLLLPGFIDIHVHGIGGYDYTSWDNEEDFIKNALGMKKKLIEHGVTTFLPTTVTMPKESLLEACKAISHTDILGLHLEGPYISEKHAGAQDIKYIRNPDREEVLECVKMSNNKILTMTYSPEKDLDFIPFLLSLGIYPSIGHTDADYETASKAFFLGANRVTHLFNAMRGFHHRDPGVILASINFSPFIEIIPDFIHVNKEVIRFLTKIVDIRRIVIVTDSITATDLEDGVYNLGKMKIIVKNGIARTEDGKLAGSTLTMDRAFKNMASIVGIREASLACSYNPARAIGLNDRGSIEKGYRADLIVMDEKLSIKKVFINGEEVFSL